MKYSKDIVIEVCKHIGAGLTAKEASLITDIGESTFYDWQREKESDGNVNPNYHVEFVDAIKKAVIQRKEYLLVSIRQDGSWQSKDYWVHFSQRFIRPEFLRRIRQRMRNSSLMASDWEEAKYSYVAFSKIPVKKRFWAKCIGPVKKYNGYLEIPLLTEQKILNFKVLKRNKSEYSFAKNLHWGNIITNSNDLSNSFAENNI